MSQPSPFRPADSKKISVQLLPDHGQVVVPKGTGSQPQSGSLSAPRNPGELYVWTPDGPGVTAATFSSDTKKNILGVYTPPGSNTSAKFMPLNKEDGLQDQHGRLVIANFYKSSFLKEILNY